MTNHDKQGDTKEFNFLIRLYIALLNPLLYPMEGIRAAFFGQGGFISFWFCISMLSFFTILFGFIGIKRLKKRLDFI